MKTIFFVIIAGVIFGFMLDEDLRTGSEDPFEVSRKFSIAYMSENSKLMKIWAGKSADEKIDQLQFSEPVPASSFDDDLELVCFRKLSISIVTTYALEPMFGESVLLYTVVLRPEGSPSLWQRCKSLVLNTYPIRWVVTDFYTDDNGAFREYVIEYFRRFRTEGYSVFQVSEDEFIKLIRGVEAGREWSEKEKVQQNKEMKKLYTDYRGLHNKNGDSD